MNTLTISDLKKHGSQSLSKTQTQILIVNSKPKAAIVPIKEYQMMVEALEDIEDKVDINSRSTETAIPADDFFKAF